jgi:hypothetical protein
VGVLLRRYSRSCLQKSSPAQVDITWLCQGGAKRSPRRGPARARSDKNFYRTGHARDVTGPHHTHSFSCCVSQGRARPLPARLGRARSLGGGRPAPSAAWAGRRSGQVVGLTSSPPSGRSPHSNPVRSCAPAGRAGGHTRPERREPLLLFFFVRFSFQSLE